MKTIVLMPVKNEDWILDVTLQAALQYADHVLISDQNSTDNTLNIINKYKNVDVITNNRTGHSNEVRWDLLDTARSKYGTNNLIISIDADEILPPFYFNKLKEQLYKSIPPGKAWISAPWVQVWRSVNTFRNDSSVWSPDTNKKPYGFVDDGKVDYERKFVINDHTGRVPGPNGTPMAESNIPLLHFQFANWQRTQEKQAWYRCRELLNGKAAGAINSQYGITKDEKNMQLSIVPKGWYKGVSIPTTLETLDKPSWYVEEIKEMFQEHGIDKFKNLDIWHVDSISELI